MCPELLNNKYKCIRMQSTQQYIAIKANETQISKLQNNESGIEKQSLPTECSERPTLRSCQ